VPVDWINYNVKTILRMVFFGIEFETVDGIDSETLRETFDFVGFLVFGNGD
jgi:hypothetical protein